MHIMQSRRDFLASLSAACAAGVLEARGSVANEGPPEVTTIRLPYNNNICIAPTNIAEQLLHAEGFTDVEYVPISSSLTWPQVAGRGEIDIGVTFAATLVFQLDRGASVTTGCIRAVTSYSRTSRSAPFATSRAGGSALRG
jgi:NitT/TauT family transport system substrate-binding protein